MPVEPTETMLIAGLDRIWPEEVYAAMVSASPIIDFPAYDEVKELAACRANWEKNPNCLFSDMWLGWKACAKSRARSAE